MNDFALAEQRIKKLRRSFDHKKLELQGELQEKSLSYEVIRSVIEKKDALILKLKRALMQAPVARALAQRAADSETTKTIMETDNT